MLEPPGHKRVRGDTKSYPWLLPDAVKNQRQGDKNGGKLINGGGFPALPVSDPLVPLPRPASVSRSISPWMEPAAPPGSHSGGRLSGPSARWREMRSLAKALKQCFS